MTETNHPASGPAPQPPHEEPMGAGLAIAQFAVTAVPLGLVATMSYLAGMRSAGKEGGEATTTSASGHGANIDLAALMKPTPELIAKGKALFAVNCASCHGANGMGDGPAAAALNPKPRNFHEGYWKYGGGIARVVQTISTGSPGTAMAAFTNIPLEDRFAIALYERSFAPKQEEDKPADLAWLGPIGGPEKGGGAPGGVAGGPAKPGPTIPIEVALRLMTEPPPSAPLGGSPPPSGEGRGAALYGERCVSCHGASGEGGVRVRMLGSAPYAYVTTLPLSANRTGWMGGGGRFEKLVLEGIPGYLMPGNGDLSSEDVRALYDFAMSLGSRQGNTPPGSPAAQAHAAPASRAASSARRPGGTARS